MVEVSEEAIKKITQFLEEQEKPGPIRILMTEGGWKGPYLVMQLDQLQENDQVITEKGVTFLIDKTLLSRVKFVKIDYIHSAMGPGYTLKSGLMEGPVEACETPPVCQTCYPHG